MSSEKKPWLCRMNLHDWSDHDGAFFITIVVCRRCGEPKSLDRATKLQRERQLFAEEESQGGTHIEVLGRVAARLFQDR